jgi:hypothetical protein
LTYGLRPSFTSRQKRASRSTYGCTHIRRRAHFWRAEKKLLKSQFRVSLLDRFKIVLVANANNLARFQNHLLLCCSSKPSFDSLSSGSFFSAESRREEKKVSNTNMILEVSALTKKKASIRLWNFKIMLCAVRRVFFSPFLRHHLSLASDLTSLEKTRAASKALFAPFIEI